MSTEIIQTGIFDKFIELFSNSGFTALLSMIVTLLITKLFDVRSEKKKEQERFFYEIYSRRIELYRKILKLINKFLDVTFSDPLADPNEIGNISGAFFKFSDTGMLVASPTVTSTLKQISDFIGNQIVIGSSGIDFERANAFISHVREKLIMLREQIRAETCPTLVDEYLSKLTGMKTTHKTS